MANGNGSSVAHEESVRRRVQDVMDRLVRGAVKLPEKAAECRHGLIDGGIYVIESKVTDATYLFDTEGGTFYRTLSPKSSRIGSSSPVEVIQQDRGWLTPFLSHLPEGKVVIERYQPGARGAAEARKEKEKGMDTVTAAMSNQQKTAPKPLDPNLIFIPTRGRETRVISREMSLPPLRIDQLQAILRKAGATVPDLVELAKGPVANSFSLKGTLGPTTVNETCFDYSKTETTEINVTPEKAIALFALISVPVSKENLKIEVTPQGYLAVSWTEISTSEA